MSYVGLSSKRPVNALVQPSVQQLSIELREQDARFSVVRQHRDDARCFALDGRYPMQRMTAAKKHERTGSLVQHAHDAAIPLDGARHFREAWICISARVRHIFKRAASFRDLK